MNLEGYLVVRKSTNRYALTARFVTKKPSIDANEISIRIECSIPDTLFSRPQLKFKIDIPKDAVPQKEITADIVGNIQELIEQNLGIDIKLISEKDSDK